MADNEQDIDVKFKFLTEGDQKVVDAFKNFNKEGAGSVAIATSLSAKFAEISRENKFAKIVQDAIALKNGLDGAEKSAQTLLEGLESIGATDSEIENAARQFTKLQEAQAGGGSSGFGSSGLRSTGRALDQIGLGSIGQPIQQLGDIGQITKQFKELSDQIPIVTTVTEALTPVLGETAAGFAAILTPVAILAAPIIAVTGAISAYNNMVNAQKKAVDDVVTSYKAYTDLQLKNIQEMQAATVQGVQGNIDTQKAQLAQIEIDKKHAQDFLADLDRQYAEADTAGNGTQMSAIRLAQSAGQQALDDQVKREAELTAAIKNNTDVILPAAVANDKKTEATKKETEATNQATKAADVYAQTVVKSATELITVTTQLKTENDKYAKTLADRVQADARATALDAQQAIVDNDKKVEAEQASAAKIVEIRQSGADAEAAALTALNVKRDEINASAMQKELQLLANYQKSEARADQDYSTSRLRKLQDLYSSLSDLAASRDVSAFVSTQASGLTQIGRDDSDFGTAAARRKEDYEQQVKDAENARQQQLQALQVSYDHESEIRADNLQKQITQAQAAATVEYKQSDKDLAKLNALKAMYAANDLKARRDAEDKAHSDLVAKLTIRQTELNNIIGTSLNPAIQFMGQLGSAVVSFITQVRNAAIAPVSAPSSNVGFGGGQSGLSASSSSRNYTPAWSRSSGNNITVNVAGIGSLVSHADLNNTVEMIVGAVERAAGVA